MKKTILKSLVVAACVTALSATAYADVNNNAVQTTQTKVAKMVRAMPVTFTAAAKTEKVATIEVSEIKGAVEKIEEHFIQVKDKDGKLYTVPTMAFEGMKEFKELKLQVGTEVVLKGILPPALPKLDADKGVVVGEMGVSIALPCVDAVTDVVIGEAGAFAASTEAVFIGEPTEEMKVQVIEGEMLPADGQHNITFSISDSVEAVPAVAAITFPIDENTQMFFAEEITANGVKVELQKAEAVSIK